MSTSSSSLDNSSPLPERRAPSLDEQLHAEMTERMNEAAQRLASNDLFRAMVELEVKIALDVALMKLLGACSYVNTGNMFALHALPGIEVEIWLPRETRRFLNLFRIDYDEFANKCLQLLQLKELGSDGEERERWLPTVVFERWEKEKLEPCPHFAFSFDDLEPSSPDSTPRQNDPKEVLEKIQAAMVKTGSVRGWSPTPAKLDYYRRRLLKAKYEFLNPPPDGSWPGEEDIAAFKTQLGELLADVQYLAVGSIEMLVRPRTFRAKSRNHDGHRFDWAGDALCDAIAGSHQHEIPRGVRNRSGTQPAIWWSTAAERFQQAWGAWYRGEATTEPQGVIGPEIHDVPMALLYHDMRVSPLELFGLMKDVGTVVRMWPTLNLE
ncbi:hypothetical protein KCU71_g2203, partial [Aureobasidium melanogenum]